MSYGNYTSQVILNADTIEYSKFVILSADTRFPSISVMRVQTPDQTQMFYPASTAWQPLTSYEIYPKTAVLTYLVNANDITLSGSATNNISFSFPGAGSTGITAPVSAIEIGYINQSGNLTGVSQSNRLPATTTLGDGVTPTTLATVTQFHVNDNQILTAANGLFTGGVTQVLNPTGSLDRQRGTGFDNIPSAGVATGTQQLAGPAITGILNSAVTASINPQSVALNTLSTFARGQAYTIQPGSILSIDAGLATQEYVFILSTTSSTKSVSAVFTKNHLSGASMQAFAFDQARSATIPDGSLATGIPAGAMYLWNQSYNNGAGGVEIERSASGELDGATGAGTNIAAEYEWQAGGPVLASGLPSGFSYTRARNLQGKGQGYGTITNTTVGYSSIIFGSAAATNTINPGQSLLLSGGAIPETVFVSNTWVSGTSAYVPLQSPVVNVNQNAAYWDVFAATGPGLNGFLPDGIGIEEEALWDPVSKQFYIERAATQDNVPGQNIVMESPALLNPAGGFDRERSGVLGVVNSVSGFSCELTFGVYSSAPPSLTANNQACNLQLDSNANLKVVNAQTSTAGPGFFTSAILVKATAGQVITLVGYNSGGPQFIQLYNQNTLPPTGLQIFSQFVSASSNFTVSFNNTGLYLSAGVVAAASIIPAGFSNAGQTTLFTVEYR